MKKTSVIKSHAVASTWHVVDAKGLILGRLASRVAAVLRGKHRPEFTPHASHGDYVIIINCEKIKVTGNKLTEKMYYNHSQYMGNLYEETLKDVLRKDPERVLHDAIRRMLPKNRLGSDMLSRLKLVVGDTHQYEAQQPTQLTF
ncbi:50S ribosomal protein L13 [Candidatus Gracilibacteria bacterium]|nr:50S ribosomal protein L13 [Candidatus Gracilibacteria bacterium]